jgi:rSAM/selenodomain-associated transferase 1
MTHAITTNARSEDKVIPRKIIAVFGKTPGLSPIKTRLATAIGKEKANELYKLCVDSTQATLEKFVHQNPEWRVVWAVGEKKGLEHPFWTERPFEKIWTGEGCLGTRLHQVYATLIKEYEAVLLTGTDSPQLNADIFVEAARHLQASGSVIGPAKDGGFYLFGHTKEIPQAVWESVPYSVENTCEELLKRIVNDVPHLTKQSDLDRYEDIQTIIDEMPAYLHETQERLIRAFKNL